MKLYTQNASALLFEKVDGLSQQRHDSWRCLHFNFCQSQYSANLRNNFVVPLLSKLLDDTDAQVYVCADGDVFILFQGRYEAMLRKLGSHFEDLNPRHATSGEDDELITIYDLSKHCQLLHDLCHHKCVQGMQARAKQRTPLPA